MQRQVLIGLTPPARDVIASSLNSINDNEHPDTELQEAINWLVTYGFGQSVEEDSLRNFANDDAVIRVSSKSLWKGVVGENTESALNLHEQLDFYNNFGIDDGSQIAYDRDDIA